MTKRDALIQPLMMRRDYGKTKDKEALMIKEVPIEDYDAPIKKRNEDGYEIGDYDSQGESS